MHVGARVLASGRGHVGMGVGVGVGYLVGRARNVVVHFVLVIIVYCRHIGAL